MFFCDKFEFVCPLKYIVILDNYFLITNNISLNRCLPYDMIRDGKIVCPFKSDEEAYIENCFDINLFLCLDQSRCIPKQLKCDGIRNCINGSDEIQGCNSNTKRISIHKIPRFFRRFQGVNMCFINDLFHLLRSNKMNSSYFKVSDFVMKPMLIQVRNIIKTNIFGLKCESSIMYNKVIYQPISQPKSSFKKSYCINQADRCLYKFFFYCFRCFNGLIILRRQVYDGNIDCQAYQTNVLVKILKQNRCEKLSIVQKQASITLITFVI